MTNKQSLTFELLVILGVVIVLISPIGDWLANLVKEIAVFHPTTLNFNPLDKSSTSLTNDAVTHGAMIPGGSGGGSSGGTSLFNVPIVDSSGGAGTIQVVAHDQASAEGNATQGGNTPTGPAVAA